MKKNPQRNRDLRKAFLKQTEATKEQQQQKPTSHRNFYFPLV